MSRYEGYLVGDKTDSAFLDRTARQYDPYTVRAIVTWAVGEILQEHPELAAADLDNYAMPGNDEIGKAYEDLADAGWEFNEADLWFLWRDEAHCHEPLAAAAALDRFADLLLTKVDQLPWLEDCIRAACSDFSDYPRGSPRDRDWSTDLEHPEEVWPLLIWTARGLAQTAREAAAAGSTKVTVLTQGLG